MALDFIEGGIVHVSKHGHGEGDHTTHPTGDYDA